MNIATSHTRLDTESPRHGALLVGCVVASADVPDLETAALGLTDRHPKSTAEQRLDMILRRGILATLDDLNLPRAGSNPDEDG